MKLSARNVIPGTVLEVKKGVTTRMKASAVVKASDVMVRVE